MNTPANQKGIPPVHVILDLAQAAVDLQHLVLLDQIWTGVAEANTQSSERDREALLIMGNRVDDQLATIERHTHNLRQFFSLYSAWVNERLRSEFAAEEFASYQKEDILRILAVENEDFAERGMALSDLLIKQLPAERDELRRKFVSLRENGPIEADMSHDVGCGLMAIGFMAALLTCPKTGVGCALAFVEGAALVHYC